MTNFTCAKCDEKFPTRDRLRRHILTIHLYPDERTRPPEVSAELKRVLTTWEMGHEERPLGVVSGGAIGPAGASRRA